MQPGTSHFSVVELLRAVRSVSRSALPPRLRSGVIWTCFRLVFIGLGRGAGKIASVAGLKVKYCTYESLLYLFREIFLRQTYFFVSDGPSPFIIDCGANIGMASLFFKLLYPEAEIFAFEPDADAFACLAANVELNGVTGVTIRNEALRSVSGGTEFYSSLSEPGFLGSSVLRSRADGPAILVSATKLSFFINREVDLLKIDIEGAETEVISELRDSGKLSMIRRIVMEYHHHIDKDADAFSDVLGMLESAGFGYQVEGSLERPLAGRRFQDILVYAYKKK